MTFHSSARAAPAAKGSITILKNVAIFHPSAAGAVSAAWRPNMVSECGLYDICLDTGPVLNA